MSYGGRTDFFLKMSRLARVATGFYFIQLLRKGIKEQEKTFLKDFGFGGKIYKGKVLAPFVSTIIRGLLNA